MNPENLEIVQAYDSALLAANFTKSIDALSRDDENQIQNIALLIEKLDKHIRSIPDCDELHFWKTALTGIRILQSEYEYQKMAINESDHILHERERLSALWATLMKNASKLPDIDNQAWIKKSVLEVGSDRSTEELIAVLKMLPLPTLYFKNKKDERQKFYKKEANQEKGASPLVKLIAFIDGVPLLSPQLLRPQLLYSLKFIVRGVAWPGNATKLHLDLPTTLPPSEYSIPKFELPKPNKEANEFEGELNGHIRFTSSQTLLSENISFVVRCAFELQDNQFYETPIIGYNQLEFRIIDPKNSGFMSNYQKLDQHVSQLVESLLSDNPSIKDELGELIPLLEALTNLLGAYAQGAIFQGSQNISESDFQAKVTHDLRLKLGADVQEHPNQAGGFTDIRYRGIVVELKVEHEDGDRKHIGERYSAQAAQYQSVEGKQVSIVLVLDLTPKINPPSDIRNDILLVNIPTHGGNDDEKQYKSKAFIFVVNGNTKKPSEYSRRKPKKGFKNK